MTTASIGPDSQLYLALADALDVELGHRICDHEDPVDRLAGYREKYGTPASPECRARADVLRRVADPATRASVGQASAILNAVTTFAKQLDVEVDAEGFLRAFAYDMIGYWEDSAACLMHFDRYLPEGYKPEEIRRKLYMELVKLGIEFEDSLDEGVW
jgi:hypothetical protein